MYFLIKTLVTALVVAGVSELARRYSLLAALLASLPLTSILAMIWLYHDTHDGQKIAALSNDILWLVAPSLIFFIALPLLLRHGFGFYVALALACVVMVVAYGIFTYARTQLA